MPGIYKVLWQDNQAEGTVTTLREPGQALAPTHLYMFAVVTPRRELDPPECDWTLERHFNGSLLHSILPI